MIWLNTVALVLLSGITGVAFAARLGPLVRSMRAGGHDSRLDHPWERVRGVVVFVLGQKRLLRWPFSGIAHFLIFWGFVVLNLEILQAALEAAVPPLNLEEQYWWGPIAFLQELLAAAVLVGLALAALNRYVLRPRRFQGSHQRDATLILVLILLVILTQLGIYSTQIAAGADQVVNMRPLSDAVAGLFRGFHGESIWAWHEFFLWAHLLIIAGFLVYLARSKHLHILTALPNVYFRSLEPAGRHLPMLDIEHADHYGLAKVEQLTWKQELDLATCTECGRCQVHCPAFNTGKPLSPKLFITDLRDSWYARARGEEQPSSYWTTAPPSPTPPQDGALLDWAVLEETLWSCTTCGACVEQCPVLIEHVPAIVEMRRSLVLEESRLPKESQRALESIEQRGNPYSMAQASRMRWAEGLDVPLAAEHPQAEYLYWVGCATAFDEANWPAARATVAILKTAGVSFAVLGQEETCNGDPARRLGNEYLFQTKAAEVVGRLEQRGVRKIIASCPHCFNTFAREYPDFGGHYEVLHHTQLLARLLDEGRIHLDHPAGEGGLTYHDPCYLGRWNGEYDAPRHLLQAIPGMRLVEMSRSRSEAMCCGAGGGRIFMEETGDQRINRVRVQQAQATGAAQAAVACPFCATMFQEGISSQDLTAKMGSADIAVLVAQAMGLDFQPQQSPPTSRTG
ncbi:MAG: (Fe-S)-binding protein [Candidatus Dormibacteraeota bacterium]|nr:(Fe-S)-binding protein [Candidatus Dormibacteraeota bacterium]